MTTTETPLTIDICVDCLSLLANGEVTDAHGNDRTSEHVDAMTELWGDTEITLGSIDNADDEDGDGGEPWFSRSPCKGCGSRLGGDRTYATAWLKPEDDDGAPCCPDPGCGGNPCTFPGYADNH